MHALNRPVHGEYPRDFGHWDHTRDLTIEEAAKLLGITEFDKKFGLFLNKGFIVLGRPLPHDGSPLDLKVGEQIIYNHDGSYRLKTFTGKR